MRSPRRIFRGQAVPGQRLLRPLAGLAAAAVAGLSAAGLSSGAVNRPAPAPERVSAEAAGVAVIDGATLRLGGHVVRLRGVEAPSRGVLCSNGHDCGGQAASALAELVRDRRVECRLMGRDRQARPLATCEAGGLDLGRAIVALGWAHADSDASGLTGLESQARQQGRGLWAPAGN